MGYIDWFIFGLLFLCYEPAQADDKNCLNKMTKVIPVPVVGDNPNKVMTYVRDDPGYTRNLECKWQLRASDYNKPRQMLLNVRNVDFDSNATAEQCRNGAVDVFNFSISGPITKGQVSSVRWCSNTDAANVPKLMLVNMWNSSSILTVEFRSDNMQVRSDAKGVEMDVVIMAEDYCHRSMLFHNGSCYLITEDLLTYDELSASAKSLLGNVSPFAELASVQRLIESNTDRQNVFPFSPPLDLTNRKVWTGNFWFGDNRSYLKNPCNCNGPEVASTVPVRCNNSDSSLLFGVALQVVDNNPVFTCEPVTAKLPALIHFTQIGTNRCNPFDTCELPTPSALMRNYEHRCTGCQALDAQLREVRVAVFSLERAHSRLTDKVTTTLQSERNASESCAEEARTVQQGVTGLRAELDHLRVTLQRMRAERDSESRNFYSALLRIRQILDAVLQRRNLP